MANIDNILKNMRKSGKLKDNKQKGNLGEEAILNICLDRQRKHGGLLFQSFKYPYQTNRSGKTYLGNIKLIDGEYIDITETARQLYDEIDILYITNYRVFIIEVKSYHARMRIYDNWLDKNGTPEEKSPITQTEKHASHLYHAIHSVLPDGNPNYIVPICVFVDRCTIKDERSIEKQNYIPVAILNNFKKTLLSRNTPLEYNLDLEAIQRQLNRVKTSVLKEFL